MSSAPPLALPTRARDEQLLESFLSERGEPTWIVERRRAAFEIWQQKLAVALPAEEFKRVDIRGLRPETFSLAATPATTATTGEAAAATGSGFSTLLEDRAEFGGHVAHVDGVCTRSDLAPELAAQGVLFGNLSDLLVSHRELLEPHFLSRAVRVDADRFSAWHATFWTGGTVLYVPRNVEVKAPLHSLIALSQSGRADFSHTLVVLEEGASATLLEETASATADGAGLHVGAVELILAPGSRLRYVQLQNWNEKTWHFAHQVGRVEKSASLQWTVGGLGSRLAHIHQEVHLDGRGAEAEVNGVTFAINRQVISYYTSQHHNAEDTRSDLLYKEVLRDRSRVIWRGMIRVEPEAQKTDGYQRSDALLLSPTSRCDSIPGLEIEADDVRCTHGATAGRVDEEQIFYCMCRGLTKFEAMHMIVEGFFHKIYDRIPVEAVRETLSQAVVRKLGFGD